MKLGRLLGVAPLRVGALFQVLRREMLPGAPRHEGTRLTPLYLEIGEVPRIERA